MRVCHALARNPHLPAEAYGLLALHRLRVVRDFALGMPHLPTPVRFAAVRAGHLHGLQYRDDRDRLTAPATIPTDIAHQILDAADPTHPRSVAGKDYRYLARIVAARSSDPGVWDRIVATPTLVGTHFAVQAASDILGPSSDHCTEIDLLPGQVSRTARVLAWLSTHHDGDLRSLAVSHLTDPETLAAAATDPHPSVRTAVALHSRVPTPVLANLVEDPDPEVAQTAADRFLTALHDRA